jgi:hypothetical protein
MQNVRILPLYLKGVKIEKLPIVDAPCFCMDVDRGISAFGVNIAPNGCKIAFALDDKGINLIPKLNRAEVLGFYANGFVVCGYNEELDKNTIRNYYQEWFVFYE